MKKEISDEKFFKKYEALEKESIEDFIKRYSSTETELRETIAYLMEHRQMMKDVEIEKLEAESANLLKKLEKIELEKMLEEIRCFKEIMSLQKKLIMNGVKPSLFVYFLK